MAEIISPFNDRLFKIGEVGGGFINDETPLDEHNMNLLIKADILNKQNIDELRSDLNGESSSRDTADKQIIQQVWGQDTIPEGDTIKKRIDDEVSLRGTKDSQIIQQVWGQSTIPTGDNIKKQIDSEKSNRETYDKRITGLSDHRVPDDYANTNEKLRAAITELSNKVATLTPSNSPSNSQSSSASNFNFIIIDGAGVPKEVLDGTSSDWDGSYEGFTFGKDE